MPKSTMRQESEYPLPADVLLPAALVSVEDRTYEFTYQAHHKRVQSGSVKLGEKGTVEKWVWKFAITDGAYAGLHAWGETEAFLSSHPDNKVRQWAEALRGAEFEPGEGIDTDDILGLACVVTVRNDEPRPKRDGSGNFYPCPVDSVFPASAMSEVPF